MNAHLDDGKRVEFLAYNIKYPEIINEWSDKFFSKEILTEKFNEGKRAVIEMCDRAGLKYNLDNIKKDIPVTDFFVVCMFYELIKYPENIEKMGENIKTFNDFRFNLGINDPNSIFYIEEKEYPKPNFRDVADIIHKAGGLVFLAHPYEFRFEDTIGYIDYMRSQVQVDGIECFHPSAETDNRIETLIKYARDNNLYISGGSDFHGPKKPNIFIGIGSGSLNIPDIYIEEWAREYV